MMAGYFLIFVIVIGSVGLNVSYFYKTKAKDKEIEDLKIQVKSLESK